MSYFDFIASICQVIVVYPFVFAAVTLDYCNQKLQYFHTTIVGSLVFVIYIVSDANFCDYERAITKFQSFGTAFMKFRLH